MRTPEVNLKANQLLIILKILNETYDETLLDLDINKLSKGVSYKIRNYIKTIPTDFEAQKSLQAPMLHLISNHTSTKLSGLNLLLENFLPNKTQARKATKEYNNLAKFAGLPEFPQSTIDTYVKALPA